MILPWNRRDGVNEGECIAFPRALLFRPDVFSDGKGGGVWMVDRVGGEGITRFSKSWSRVAFPVEEKLEGPRLIGI